MKNKLNLICGIIIFLISTTIIGLSPLFFKGVTIIGIVICLILSNMSFYYIQKDIKIEKKIITFFVSWLSNYIALIMSVVLFEVIIEYLLNYYHDYSIEKYNLIENIYVNDLSRKLLVIFGILYSLMSSLFILFLRKIEKIIRSTKSSVS